MPIIDFRTGYEKDYVDQFYGDYDEEYDGDWDYVDDDNDQWHKKKEPDL